MRLGFVQDGRAQCHLCEWVSESNAGTDTERCEEVTKEFIDHLRYTHDRRLVTKEAMKSGRVNYHGPAWAYEMTKNPLGGCRIKRNR